MNIYPELAAQRSKFIDSCGPFHSDSSYILGQSACFIFGKQPICKHWSLQIELIGRKEKLRSVLQTGSCQLVAAKNSQFANSHWPMRKGFYRVGKSEHQLVQAEYGASRVPIVRPLSIQIYTTESPNSNLFWKGGRKWASFYIFEGISWGEIFLEWFKNGKIMFSF